MIPKTRHHANLVCETFAYRGAEWHRKSLGSTGLLYDSDNVIADLDGSTVSRFYVTPMLDQNVSMTIASGPQAGTYWYSQDERSSVRTLTDSTGAVVNRYDYTAFGEDVSRTTFQPSSLPTFQPGNRYTYTGRELNPFSGNFYFRYRTYGPALGQFFTRDPLGYMDGPSLHLGYFVVRLGTDPHGTAESDRDPSDIDLWVPPPSGVGLVQKGKRRAVELASYATEECYCCPSNGPWSVVEVATTVNGATLKGKTKAWLLEVNTLPCMRDVKWAWYTCQRGGKGGPDGFFPNGTNADFEDTIIESGLLGIYIVVTYCDMSKPDAKGSGRIKKEFKFRGIGASFPPASWNRNNPHFTWPPFGQGLGAYHPPSTGGPTFGTKP